MSGLPFLLKQAAQMFTFTIFPSAIRDKNIVGRELWQRGHTACGPCMEFSGADGVSYLGVIGAETFRGQTLRGVLGEMDSPDNWTELDFALFSALTGKMRFPKKPLIRRAISGDTSPSCPVISFSMSERDAPMCFTKSRARRSRKIISILSFFAGVIVGFCTHFLLQEFVSLSRNCFPC